MTPDRDDAGTAAVLRRVLQEVSFPAHRWQIVTVAETYGDSRTRSALRRLGAPEYQGIDDVVAEIAEQRPEHEILMRPEARSFTPTTRAPAPYPSARGGRR
jgi:hypothetical protein